MSNAIVRNPVVSRAEAERLVAAVGWFHRVEVLPGLIAPGFIPSEGSYGAAAYIDSMQLGDLQGKRILELGTWDGPLAFELAARGADIVASDIQNPKNTGFHVLQKVSGLNVPYTRCSVYDLSKHFRSEFDIVLFLGIFYHLKHPILAFEQVASVLKMGGTLICEGAGIGGYFENLEQKEVSVTPEMVGALDAFDDLGVPLTLSYPGYCVGARNWVFPNKSALRGWMTSAGFDVTSLSTQGNPNRRIIGRAIKNKEKPMLEHDLVGEDAA